MGYFRGDDDNWSFRSSGKTARSVASSCEDSVTGGGGGGGVAASDEDDRSIATFRSAMRNHPQAAMRNHPQVTRVAAKEHRAVLMTKLLVMVVLGLALLVIALITYFTIRNSEYEDFTAQFANYASEVIAVSSENVKNTFGTIEAFSISVTSIAQLSNQTWPFVTIPDWEARGNRVRKLANDAYFVILASYFTDEQRPEFEEWANANVDAQLQASIDYAGSNLTIADLKPGPFKGMSKVNLTTNAFYPHEGPGPYLANWQRAPFNPCFIMMDMYHQKTIADAFLTANITKTPVMNFGELSTVGVVSQVIQPIFREVPTPRDRSSAEIVAILRVAIFWGSYFENLLAEGTNGVVVVMEDTCELSISYEIRGLEAKYLGLGDHHDPRYDDLEVVSEFISFEYDENITLPPGRCVPDLVIHVYPSAELQQSFETNKAAVYTTIVVAVMIFTSLVFVSYDVAVRRRERIVGDRLERQDQIVGNLFPESIRERLYGAQDGSSGRRGVGGGQSGKTPLPSAGGVPDLLIDKGDVDNPDMLKEPPIADLFLSTTVLFADISGFTAWSSAREPTQVFALLESLYGAFDKLAREQGVFKVETVGDCYVAVCGLPTPRSDHASAMARFARDAMHKMKELVLKLEVSLGPDTSDMELRAGMHSGQCTAGVLRGERSRFQLFGDTVNTAARMETTSMRSRIQLSSETARLLSEEGKSSWYKARRETVSVKGKGEMQTFWLKTRTVSSQRDKKLKSAPVGVEMAPISERDDSSTTGIWDDDDPAAAGSPAMVGLTKMQRLVEWNVEVLSKLLKQIVAARLDRVVNRSGVAKLEHQLGQGSTVLEEFKEIITLPKVRLLDLQLRRDPQSIQLSEAVSEQLREFVSLVANSYRENAFHNFEHASHVTASVRKLLSRIVRFDHGQGLDQNVGDVDLVDLAGHSYGITSDPLTQFAVVFSAIIHDMDHPGVTNAQLVHEKAAMAAHYKEKSVAEQNSVDLAWEMLMRSEFKDLRACIYCNSEELKRFRQLVVNVVMATDICDKELQALRKARWETAFSKTQLPEDATTAMDRKATIVIEHLIQASDVSHTMQHWQVYKQWNERFFVECYGAYKQGRAATDPSEGWYKGEIGFFDFYIIPLAKKLESCGVFGVSSHEYLNYAIANRDEWEREGKAVVEGFLEKYRAMSPEKLEGVLEEGTEAEDGAESEAHVEEENKEQESWRSIVSSIVEV